MCNNQIEKRRKISASQEAELLSVPFSHRNRVCSDSAQNDPWLQGHQEAIHEVGSKGEGAHQISFQLHPCSLEGKL